MIGLLVELALLVAVGGGVWAWVRSRQAGRLGDSDEPRDRGGLVVAGQVVLYVVAFAGLLAVLYAASGLLTILLALALPHGATLIAAADIRGRASFSLAALIVGLPLWLGIWTIMRRRRRPAPAARAAGARRLFLAAAWATAAVVALFAARTLLQGILTLPGPPAARPAPLDGIAAATRLLVYGAAFACYARLYRRERDPRGVDGAHDLAVYVVAGFGLGFFAMGLYGAMRELTSDLQRIGHPALLAGQASPWIVWGSIVAPLVAGGVVWVAVWRYDLWRGGQRALRVVYLYVVLTASVIAALGAGTDGLYEFLRRLFGYHPGEGDWTFLPDVLPPLILGGVSWAYHWVMVRRQARLVTVDGARGMDTPAAGAIVWPRRPALALLAALGLAMAAPAVISLLWVGLDAIVKIGGAFAGADWWRDRLSLGMAAAVVGFGAWLVPWAVLQRAAAVAPARERAAQERRLLLGAVTVLSALTAIGFAIALLWLILRSILGERLDVSATGDALKDGSAALVLVALALSHGLVLRRDLRVAVPMAARLRIIALLAPGAEDTLARLRETGLQIDVGGYLSPLEPGPTPTVRDAAGLRDDLVAAATAGARGESALLILGPDGGVLYTYTRGAARPAAQGATSAARPSMTDVAARSAVEGT